MKMVVLDGYTLNPGDLSWDPLQALGELTVHDRTEPDRVAHRMAGAEIVFTNKTVLDRETIGSAPALRYIGVIATGYDIVDVDAARARGIPVTNVPAYATRAVAQMVFAHILHLTNHVAYHGRTVREGRWTACPDFCYWDRPLVELDGLTMGIVGFGRIGRATAELAIAFGMKVLAHDVARAPSLPDGVAWADLDRLFRESDVVSLHCPLTDRTEHLVDAERLAAMKPTALLINTSRGPLVDDVALARALQEGQIAGAGLDVLATEPPPADSPLLAARNAVITPHISWATRAARMRLLHAVAENVAAFLAGRPQNVVNP